MYLLGYDIGSSSIKASLLDAETGKCAASSFSPKREMTMNVPQPGWAEQEPEEWWKNLKLATVETMNRAGIQPESIGAIGIAYQMHGLVLIDKKQRVLRPSIIWCDSRAVETGERAFSGIGRKKCLEHFLNSPGNFTASKLRWVRENEPGVYRNIHKMLLPGDYIALKLTGEAATTISGLSEGIMWDFKNGARADLLLDYFDIDPELLPPVLPVFSEQGRLTATSAGELGLKPGIPIAYRAGDQPNNAFSLRVLEPGEIAATAGTSGVVYGVSDRITFDIKSRVNTFAHVNHEEDNTRLGILLCINGTGSLNAWLKRNFCRGDDGYDVMNERSASVPPGSGNVSVLPFGNGAERILENHDIGCHMCHLTFNVHTDAHLYRAAQEGIVFAFNYGMKIMEKMGVKPAVIRAGNTNMFLSPVFREALAGITGAAIELYNTDGSQGAARGAGLGSGVYASSGEAFTGLKILTTIIPDENKRREYEDAYSRWLSALKKFYQPI